MRFYEIAAIFFALFYNTENIKHDIKFYDIKPIYIKWYFT